MDAFESWAESLGGLVPENELGDGFLDALRGQFQNRVPIGKKSGGPMQLRVGVVRNSSFGAWAIALEDCDCIAITEVVPAILMNVFRILLSHPNYWPDTGKIEHQNPFVISQKPLDFVNNCVECPVSMLSDQKRENMARSLARLALAFVMEHEFAHIWNGHCDWLNAHQGIGTISENVSLSDSAKKNVARQTLEWDADLAAIQRILTVTLRPIITTVEGVDLWSLPKDSPWGDHRHAIHAALAATIVVFRLFDVDSALGEFELLSRRTHPPFHYRISNVRSGIHHNLVFRKVYSDPEALKILVKEEQNITYIWKEIFPLEENFWNDFESGKMTPEHYMNNLRKLVSLTQHYEDQWAVMYPELDKLKRGGRLAPPQYKPSPDRPEVR